VIPQNHEDIVFLIALMSTRGVGPKTFGRVLAEVRTVGLTPTDFARISQDDLRARYGLQGLPTRSDLEKAERDVEEMMSRGISVLWLDEPRARALGEEQYEELKYPVQLAATLGIDAPPVLFAAGELSLLTQPGVGFCGSRDATQGALEVVSVCASELADSKLNVISGYARGVDLSAHHAALKAGGVTTMVLAEGILRFAPKTEVRDFVTPYNTLVLSEFPPRLPWSVGNAMRRNSTICAFADALVVVESKLSGGTFAAGNVALELGRPLFVVDYADPSQAPGNRFFIERGARPLRRNRESGKPNTSGLAAAAQAQAVKDDKLRADWSSKGFLWRTILEPESSSPSLAPGLWTAVSYATVGAGVQAGKSSDPL
jgi:DNA protecting protein DprA